MMHRHEHELAPELERAIATLREPPPLDAAWVRQVTRTAMTPRLRVPRATARRVHLTPLTALAAALTCMLVGAGATAITLRARDAGAPMAAQTSSARMRVRFTLEAPAATTVSIVGDFNGWNPTSLPMRREADGTWTVEVPLAPGRYAYSFLVDGQLARDPAAPQARDDDFGSSNSVVMVRGS